jgi:hypothetical protein
MKQESRAPMILLRNSPRASRIAEVIDSSAFMPAALAAGRTSG